MSATPTATVAAGILPAVEGGILPPEPMRESGRVPDIFPSPVLPTSFPPGWKPGSTAGRMPAATATADLRRMSAAELEKLGQDSLRDHILAQAVVAHQKHGPLTFDKLESLLNDPGCVRHPTRLVFEFGEMAMHQFAQPDVDWRNQEQDGRVLYLRPLLRERPDLVVLAIAYMIPLINYGEIISDEHCLLYGATLLGLMEAEYYEQMCALADRVGAQACVAGNTVSSCCV